MQSFSFHFISKCFEGFYLDEVDGKRCHGELKHILVQLQI